MTWLKEFSEFARKLLLLQDRVERNSEEINALRKDLNALTNIVHQVARTVESQREKQEDAHRILILQLENQLLRFEKRLEKSSSTISLDGSQDLKRLPDGNGDGTLQ